MKKIYGDTVIITGASSGIGKSIAYKLANNGYKVYGTSRKGDYTRIFEKENGFIEMIPLDITQDDSVNIAIEYVIKKEKKIDILINNAGTGIAGSVEDTSIDEAKFQFETNFFGVLRMCNKTIPYMRSKNLGLIVNISSVAGYIPIPYQSMYSASKYALEALTRCLRIELSSFGIKATLIQPGDTKTGFTKNRIVVEKSKNNSPYDFSFSKSIEKMAKDEQNGHPPEKVAQYVLNAINKKNPAVSKTVGIEYKILAFAKRLLPTKLEEFIIGLMYNPKK